MKKRYHSMGFEAKLALADAVRKCDRRFPDWNAAVAYFSRTINHSLTANNLKFMLKACGRSGPDLVDSSEEAARRSNLTKALASDVDSRIAAIAQDVAQLASEVTAISRHVHDLSRRLLAIERADHFTLKPSLTKEPACTTHS